jgi:hypothetical protein
MTIAEFKEWLKETNVPDTAKISFWGNGDGAFYQMTNDVDYNVEKNIVEIGY